MDLVTRLGLTQAAKPGSSFSRRERGRPPLGGRVTTTTSRRRWAARAPARTRQTARE